MHLYFADNNVLFCKADTQNTEAIRFVLKDFATIFGQEVSFQKSSLYFDKLVSNSLQDSIASILGIHSKGNPGIQLGMPLSYS